MARSGPRGPRRKVVDVRLRPSPSGGVELRWDVLECGHLVHIHQGMDTSTRTGVRHCRECLRDREETP